MIRTKPYGRSCYDKGILILFCLHVYLSGAYFRAQLDVKVTACLEKTNVQGYFNLYLYCTSRAQNQLD